VGAPQLSTIHAPDTGADPEGPLVDDILVGAAAIAVYLFGTPKARRQVYRLSTEVDPRYRIPTFKMGHVTLCARKSSLKRWIAEQETARMTASKEEAA
jgi:hypothetical protein